MTKKDLITSAYYVNEIGIYAKEEGQPDSAAVLVSMAVTASTSGNGDFMPPYSGQNPATITQVYSITVDDEANVTINVAGAALLAEDANKITDDVTKKRYKLGISNGNMYYVEASEQEEKYVRNWNKNQYRAPGHMRRDLGMRKTIKLLWIHRAQLDQISEPANRIYWPQCQIYTD